MSRKAPLYDPNMINEDLRCRGLSMLARLLFAQLAALANTSGGFVMIGTRYVTPEQAARAVAFEGDIGTLVTEIVGMGLLEDTDEGWIIPEIRAAQLLREKRSKAGANGGRRTTENRTDVRRDNVYPICSSKRKNVVKSNDYQYPAKKEKRTKKEKNNKYIYIYQNKVFDGDRGELGNPVWFSYCGIEISTRVGKAIADHYGVNTEYLRDILEPQAEYIAGRGPQAVANWLPITLAWLKTQLTPVGDNAAA